jgi:hypothetical protein
LRRFAGLLAVFFAEFGLVRIGILDLESFVTQIADHLLRESRERLEYAGGLDRNRLEDRGAPDVEPSMQFLEDVRVRLVALVVLEDERNILQRPTVVAEHLSEFVQAVRVVIDAFPPGVDHHHDPIDLIEKLLSGRCLTGTSRHGDELDPGS